MDGDLHLGRSAFVGARAQCVADHSSEARHLTDPSFHGTATRLRIALDRRITSAKRRMRGRRRTSGIIGYEVAEHTPSAGLPDRRCWPGKPASPRRKRECVRRLLVGVPLVLQVVLHHRQPQQGRGSAVRGDLAQGQRRLAVGIEVRSVHHDLDVGGGRHHFRHPPCRDVPGVDGLVAQQAIDLLDRVTGQKLSGPGPTTGRSPPPTRSPSRPASRWPATACARRGGHPRAVRPETRKRLRPTPPCDPSYCHDQLKIQLMAG